MRKILEFLFPRTIDRIKADGIEAGWNSGYQAGERSVLLQNDVFNKANEYNKPHVPEKTTTPRTTRACPKCNGAGSLPVEMFGANSNSNCTACHGTGRVSPSKFKRLKGRS